MRGADEEETSRPSRHLIDAACDPSRSLHIAFGVHGPEVLFTGRYIESSIGLQAPQPDEVVGLRFPNSSTKTPMLSLKSVGNRISYPLSPSRQCMTRLPDQGSRVSRIAVKVCLNALRYPVTWIDWVFREAQPSLILQKKHDQVADREINTTLAWLFLEC